MNNIKWEDGAVCFADGKQWFVNKSGKHNKPLISERNSDFASFEWLIFRGEPSINEIRQGDYIEASELDTEQKYNDTVEMFILFGFEPLYNYEEFTADSGGCYNTVIADDEYKIDFCDASFGGCQRKITYLQLMAIGKLKRAMLEKYAPKIAPDLAPYLAPDLAPDVEINVDWSDEHYNHFYQLTDKDIELGKIKVDAYFVNRMWKINSWEDTGAGFHILKTLPRIANNKNSLKRELTALKKQVDILCKLHGVDDDTN